MSAPRPDTGNYYPWLQALADRSPRSLSFLSRDWPEPEQWRIRARAKVQELLSYDTEAADPEPEILETESRPGFARHRVRYRVTPERHTEAYLLIPDGLGGPAPAVMALHDHGGFYYYGKEKLTAWDGAPRLLRDFVGEAYQGRPYADELARRGFVVLCPDAFYFGSQRLDPRQVAEYFTGPFPGLDAADPDEAIAAFNRFAQAHEHVLAKYLFAAGTTWPGVLFQGDRASLSYLLTRPEVDPQRIGSMGLSIGGYRSAHLFALDPRVRVGVVAGWMPSYPRQMLDRFRHHTWMVYIPRLLEYLDVPDVASLGAPNPLLVLNCAQDGLYPMESMRAAEETIAAVYGRLGAGARFRCRYYDVPHSLTVVMQEDACAWLEAWLAPAAAAKPERR
ncbi:MAG: dienelactone hydrolase family protein [Gemmatimonadota bacterium]